VKCSKTHPICTNCLKTCSECVYDPRAFAQQSRPPDESQRRQKRPRDVPRTAGGTLAEALSSRDSHGERPGTSQEIAARLDRLTSMIERLSQTQSLPDDIATAMQEGALSRPISGSPRQGEHSGSEDFPLLSGPEGDLDDPVGTLNLGHLTLDDCGRSR
jgi:hypothetical protein